MEFIHRKEKGGLYFSPNFACNGLYTPIQSEERLVMEFSRLVEHVSKKTIPTGVKRLIAEVLVLDEEGEDVDVRFAIKKVVWLI